MSKLNRKAVEANLRNKLAAQYKERIEALKNLNAILNKRYNEMWDRAREAEIERDQLKDKVAQYEDWNRRLQEFMDMSDEDRKIYIEKMKQKTEINARLNNMYNSTLFRIFSIL